MMMERYWKVLDHDRMPYHGGKGQWLPPGEWMPEVAGIRPCLRGYHVVRDRDLVHWLGPCIHRVEIDDEGEVFHGANKVVASCARLTSEALPTWTERTARLFACDCAERVAHLAARPAVGAAVAAARAASEREWQTTRLIAYLEGRA